MGILLKPQMNTFGHYQKYVKRILQSHPCQPLLQAHVFGVLQYPYVVLHPARHNAKGNNILIALKHDSIQKHYACRILFQSTR